jgi:hypothetical protein
MPAFRIYTVGRDGHFKGVKGIECADDQEAIHEAQQALDGRDIEPNLFYLIPIADFIYDNVAKQYADEVRPR